ncbi:MAG TPA: hypothetical protein VD999_04745 [Vitreimonas sp.]|nr:hypothetical protein [Vitreimonas sp.]
MKKSLLVGAFISTFVVATTGGVWSRTVMAAGNCDDIKCSKDSQSEDDYLSCNKQKQSCWEEKIHEAQNASITLNSSISILNGKIQVQELQIDQTLTEIAQLEKQIVDLTKRIAGLDLSLDRLTDILIKRVQEQYKRRKISPLAILLNSTSFNHSLNQYKYVKLAQEQTADAMQQAEVQKQTYDEQKALKETKQTEVERKKVQLERQQGDLTKQRAEQQYLLQETKNNEAVYKRELEKTMAELEAIQSIIAGKGEENKTGEVKQGDQIATVIVGASPCSTGSHLHFEVVKDGGHRDPAGYLKGVDAAWSNSPDGSFGFGGDWDWPVNNPARINQGYGMTYYARVKRAYGGAPHTGIDMISKDGGEYKVKAVKPGTLYRGSIKCGGGLLRYVKVEHKDDGFSTYYLHVNY